VFVNPFDEVDEKVMKKLLYFAHSDKKKMKSKIHLSCDPGWPLVLESPGIGIGFSPGKASWKTGKFEKSPGKVLEFNFDFAVATL